MSSRPSPLTSPAAAEKPMAGTATPDSSETSPNWSLPSAPVTFSKQDLRADGREEDVRVAVVVVVEDERRHAGRQHAHAGLVEASRKRPCPSLM